MILHCVSIAAFGLLLPVAAWMIFADIRENWPAILRALRRRND